ncbi:ATP-binding protein [Zoogloea sp. LCSB751]|uniref:ATP-binding protein n=1 Tax=Zoogloea sp. LCSB751 TaxID=1965277 RepID=UPI0009A4DF95|nr:ATP-binding protein [Zoogloea sp. LCSB751]
MARINLRKFIAEHYKGGVSARDVIREALTNSIHAGSKQISVDLHFSEKQQELTPGTEERRVLETITIVDDGEGFTPENLNFFDEVCTGHKDSIGGKGVGRLAFLKYAKSVKIRSQLSSELVEFDYTPEFKLDDVKKSAADGAVSTSITLMELKEKINTQVTKLVNAICDDLRLLLFLKHQAGHSITLKFTHNSRQPFDDNFTFSGEAIKAELTREFEFLDQKFNCYLFRDEPPRKGIVAMLCADELCIEEYVISKRFDICRHLIFVTSDYFNQRSNIERQRLELPKTDEDVDMVSPISREKLTPRIHEECMKMIDEAAEGDVDQFKNQNVDKLKKYYPFIKLDSLGGNASLLDADEVVKTYRAQQARREDQLIDALESGRPVSWDDVSHLASEDLARFIVHRALVIDSLAKMPPSSAEDALHNAILPKRTDGSEIRENNVWLVDDKFLSYSNIYSDETLAKIIEEVGQSVAEKQQRRPDVAAFFSKDDENHPNKLVIIEFKKPGADIFENNKALMQCRLYASELADRISTVLEVFAFSVVEIDDAFYRDMKQTGFKDVFSLNDRVVYNDYKIGSTSDIPLHLYVMPASALIKDAKARNRVFEEVLQFDVAK